MNPLEVTIIALSGLLVVVLLTWFINDLRIINSDSLSEVDLINIINIHKAGMNLNAPFNVSYKATGAFSATSSELIINNASRSNPGFPSVSCNNTIMISEEGVTCLRN